MCIVLAGEEEPDTTKLFSVPVIINNNEDATLSLYVNNFNIHSNNSNHSNSNLNNRMFEDYSLPSMDRKPTMSGLYYNVQGQLVGASRNEVSGYPRNEVWEPTYGSFNRNKTYFEENTNSKHGAIMVVAYPIERDIQNPTIGLVDISTKEMKNFREEVRQVAAIGTEGTISNNMSRSYDSFDSEKPLEVYDVGSYKISVALRYNDLQNRLDWTKFTKPSDFELRIKTLLNPQLYPPSYRWFYVIAEAVKNIENDGFGVVSPRLTGDLIYFPTAHEERESLNYTDYNFDYMCYGYSLRPKQENGLHRKISSSDYSQILRPLRYLTNLKFIDLNKKELKLYADPNIKNLNILKKKGTALNHNWFI
jgi:hypothetical protein